MNTPSRSPRALFAHISVLAFITFPASVAFAGTGGGGGQAATDITNMLNDVIAFMTGPIVMAFATIMFIAALLGALFGGGGDAMKKALVVVAILAAIIAAPGIISQVYTAAGAVV